MMFYRGKGILVPVLLVAAGLLSLAPSRLLQLATLPLLLACALFTYWLGTRTQRKATESFGRRLEWWEKLFDLNFAKAQPFDSFAFIQLRWWSVAFLLALLPAALHVTGRI